MKRVYFLFLFLVFNACAQNELPKGFVYIQEVIPNIIVDAKYYGDDNFIGQPIDGYKNNTAILSKEAASALKKVQNSLNDMGLGLKIFDAYRPQQAVDHFVRWARVASDTLMKTQFYPNVPKSELFKQGYIAAKSGHSRGSTVDLTIINLKTGEELDMGSPFDFFGIPSHPFYRKISDTQKENRMLLRREMLKKGFKPYDNEWWHFTLEKEPYPKTYFNFPVK